MNPWHRYIPFEINRQGLRSDQGAVAVLTAGTVLGFFILNATLQASSRVVWSFARDNGFAFSHILSRVHPRLEVPVWALLFNWVFVAILGVLILASSIGEWYWHLMVPLPGPSIRTRPILSGRGELEDRADESTPAFNAILSSTVVHQLLSYLIPMVLLIYQRRSSKFLPADRSLALPKWLGWIANIAVVLAIPVLVVFFAMPPFKPVTGTNMSMTPSFIGRLVPDFSPS